MTIEFRAAAGASGDDHALTTPAAAKALTCARTRGNSNLGHARRRDRHDGVHDEPVERGGRLGRSRIHPPDHLRDVARVPLGAAGIDPLGRERQEEIVASAQSPRLEPRANHLVHGPRIGGGLQHDELSGPQVRGHRLNGRHSRHRVPGGPDVGRVVSEGAPAVHVVGDHRSDLDGYGTWLLRQGYSTERAREHFQAAPRLVRRLQQQGVWALTSLTRARLRACRPADSQEDPDLAVLVRQLARYCESELALYPPPALTRVEQRVAAYRTYLQQVRGFAPSTLTHHGRTAGEFLAHIDYETHPLRLATLDRRDLDTFLCAVAPRQSRASLQHVVANLRAFLRFLASAGEVPTGLDTQIDTPRVYRGEKLPRALPWDTVRALLQSIDRSSPLGRRDYAIFLLMAIIDHSTMAKHDRPPETEHRRRHVLLTVLGTSPRAARYGLREREVEAQLEPAALFELLPPANRPDLLLALCTARVKEESWPPLEQVLRNRCGLAGCWCVRCGPWGRPPTSR